MDQSSSVAKFLCSLIRLYQILTMGLPRRCRFTPSCSEYVRDALIQEGVWKGLSSGTARILKCHPWHPGGYDPVAGSGTR